MRNSPLSILTPLLLVTPACCYAERFFTVEQAQKMLFPSAQYFKDETFTLSDTDLASIESATGTSGHENIQIIQARDTSLNLLGYLLIDRVIGKHEYITYAVAVGTENQIKAVEILEYLESYGGEITSAEWREQFLGKNAASELTLTRDIQNISGATLSCKHVTEGVKRVLQTLSLLQRTHRISTAHDS